MLNKPALDLSTVSKSEDIYSALSHAVVAVDDVKTSLIAQNIVSEKCAPQSLHLLRLDQLHPIVSGNKLFKLLPYIQLAEHQNATTLVSFGGRFSNHLHALAYLGHCMGLSTVAFVRGYKEQALTPMLEDVLAWGMRVEFIGNTEYKLRHNRGHWQQRLLPFQQVLLIPEGGASFDDEAHDTSLILASYKRRSSELLAQLVFRSLFQVGINKLDVISTAVGSAGFLQLLIDGLGEDAKQQEPLTILAVLALKNAEEVQGKLEGQQLSVNTVLLENAHCGGFAKITKELVELISLVYKDSGILLDPIYNAKQVLAVTQAINKGECQGRSIVMIHSGGLQGVRGLYDKMRSVYGKPLPFNIG